jgi:chromosomal replication initiation ATPase DnaA
VAQQLTFDLGHRTAVGRDDFLVTPSNAEAVALVDQWPNWPGHAAELVGLRASGKSHLAQVWQQRTGARYVLAKELDIDGVPGLLAPKAVIVEEVEDLGNERGLFHLLNQARQVGGHVLLTAQKWPLPQVTLPDLKSRLDALPFARILPPDDALLRGVLVKQFNDRQLTVDEALVSYLLARMPRSLEVARQLVARIDEQAMAEGNPVTRSFAAKVLAEFDYPELL